MFKKAGLFLTLFALGFSLTAIAASDENVVIVPSKSRTEVVREVREKLNSPSRTDKSYEMSFMPMSLSQWTGANAGVNAGLFMDSNSLVNVSYSWSMESYGCTTSYECEFKTKSLGVSYKKFLTSTFYVQGGINQHQIRFTEEDEDLFFPEIVYEYGFTADVTAASFAIGNQWLWNDFTLGVDWIGMEYPLMTSFRNESASDNWKYKLRDKKEEYTGQGAMLAARLYLGASF